MGEEERKKFYVESFFAGWLAGKGDDGGFDDLVRKL